MKKLLLTSKAFLLLCCFMGPVFAWAQTYPGCTTSAPIDGGLSILLGVGAVSYGAKKLAEKRNAKK